MVVAANFLIDAESNLRAAIGSLSPPSQNTPAATPGSAASGTVGDGRPARSVPYDPSTRRHPVRAFEVGLQFEALGFPLLELLHCLGGERFQPLPAAPGLRAGAREILPGIVWLRMPGDIIFSIGVGLLALFVFKLFVGKARDTVAVGTAAAIDRTLPGR